MKQKLNLSKAEPKRQQALDFLNAPVVKIEWGKASCKNYFNKPQS